MYAQTKTGKNIWIPSDKEDAEINAKIASDEDDEEITEEWFKNAIPFDQLPKEMQATLKAINKGGRPKLENPKVFTTIRFDAEILESFKSTGKGWQTRINNALKDWLMENPL